jgi:hypothetical protein
MHKTSNEPGMQFHGIGANAVAYKAELLMDKRKESLLFFIQAMSLRRGGLKAFARELVAEFSDRVGTPTMHKHKPRNDQALYPADVTNRIEGELNPNKWAHALWEEAYGDKSQGESKKRVGKTRADLVAECRCEAEEHLPQYLVSLCVNPRVAICLPGEPDNVADRYWRHVVNERDELPGQGCEAASVPYFNDLIGAMCEYQQRLAERSRAAFVMTEIAQQVFGALDIALRSPGRIALIEGREGVGKTAAVVAWCEQHSGEARFVSLRGITNRTTFFHALATALGVQIASRNVADLQMRIEDALHRSRLMIVIDEAQYLLPSVESGRKSPDLLNYVYTAFANFNVPVALSTTALFTAKLRKVEERVTWNSGQIERRIRPYVKLPDKVRKEDLIAIARAALPCATTEMVNVLVGYAGPSRYQLSNLIDAVADAARMAEGAGRDKVTLSDLKAAVNECRLPSDTAAAQAFGPQPSHARRSVAQAPCRDVAAVLHEDDFTNDSPPKTTRPGGLNGDRLDREMITT